MPKYRGVYINMKDSTDRRETLEAHLAELGLEQYYERFEAVVGRDVHQEYATQLSPGALGCGLSHDAALKRYADCGEHLHIIEDDTVLSSLVAQTFDAIEDKLEWDIIFTDTYMLPSPIGFNMLNRSVESFAKSRKVTLMRLGDTNLAQFASESSYFVHRDSIGWLGELLSDYWKFSKRDSYTTKAIVEGKIRAFITVPFLSTISGHALESTINDPDEKQGVVDHLDFMRLLRESLYVTADVEAIHDETLAKAQQFDYTRRLEIFAEMMKYHLHFIDGEIEQY